MAGIIIVVFGASRLTLVQYNQSNRDEDNIFALYAAKAGVEDGLLRFRYNRDAETSSTATKTFVARYNLTNGRSEGEVEEASTAPATYKQTDQFYDMKLNFRGQQIGSFDDTNAGKNPPLEKDATLELTGFPAEGTDQYFLRYRFDFVDGGSGCEGALVQIQQVQQTSSSSSVSFDQVTVKKQPTTMSVDSTEASQPGNLYIRVNPGTGNEGLTNMVRLRAYGCKVRYAMATSKDNSGRGSGQDSDEGPNFDSTKSTITSTGYYGAAQRTLIAEIDRVSGQLISIYDFNLYAGGSGDGPNSGNIKAK